MSILVQCRCGQSFQAEPFLAGKTVPCPRCHQPLVIPGQPAVPVAKPAVPVAARVVPVARPVTPRAPVARPAPPPVPVLPPMPNRPASNSQAQPQQVHSQPALPPSPQAAFDSGPIVAAPKPSTRRRSSSSNVPIIVGAVAVIGLMTAGAVAIPFWLGSLPRTGLLAGGSSRGTPTPPISLPRFGQVCQLESPQMECWLPAPAQFSEEQKRVGYGRRYVERMFVHNNPGGDGLQSAVFGSATQNRSISLNEAANDLAGKMRASSPAGVQRMNLAIGGVPAVELRQDASGEAVVHRMLVDGNALVTLSLLGTPEYVRSVDAQTCLNSLRYWRPGQASLRLGTGESRRTTSR